MSGSVNKVILLGNLGKDPEVRRTADGRPVVTFPVATGESWRDKATGERKQRTDWHSVVIFNEAICKVAEQYLKKGSKVFLIGAQKTRKWEDKNGVERYTTETVLGPFGAELKLLDRRERQPGADSTNDYGTGDEREDTPPPRGDDPPPPAAGDGKPDDEIPF
ncbi:MAG: single-stranded DNA-binding protein [Pseudolabrys sp.]